MKISRTISSWIGAALLAASVLPAAGWAAQPATASIGSDGKHDLSKPLRDLTPIPSGARTDGQEIPMFSLPRPSAVKIPAPVSAAERAGAAVVAAMPTPIQNFDGVSNVNGVLPPDTNGDVGPNHYVQMINISFAIYNKSGTLLYGPANNNTLWAGFGGPCETTNSGDPIAQYDQLADRWLMSQFALPNYPSGPFYQCIAISQTPDPLGAWHRYEFTISSTKLNDYPKFGVWPDGYYMSINQFNAPLFSWGGAGVVAFERDKMLAGLTAQKVYFDLFGVDSNLGGMLPSDLDGATPPPAGAPNYFMQMDDDAWGYSPDQLQIWKFHVDWATPANSTFTLHTTLPTGAFDSNLCGYARNCIPQPGTTAKVDAIPDRLMYRLAYRNFGTHEALVMNHSVDASGADLAGVRWYEVRDPGGAPTIHQQGVVAPDSLHRWMGSLAMDGAGNIGLGYSVSSATVFPSIRYTGRLAADPLGTMPQGEAELIAGTGSQTSTSSRWGDYSMMAVDPVDDCTFWYTTEYYNVTSTSGWRTRIGSFKFPGCGTPPAGADLSVAKVDTPDPVTVGANITYTVTVTNNGSQDATLVSLTDPLPASVSYVSAVASQGTCTQSAGTVSCDLGGLVNGASATATIVATATASGTVTNTASVSAAESDPNAANNTASATTTINAAGTADLVMTSISNPPASAARLTQFSVTDTVANQGGASAGSSTNRYYLSLDTVKSSNDRPLAGRRVVPVLAAGASSSGTVSVRVPSAVPTGTYYLIGCADVLNVVAESNEANNCEASTSTVIITP